MANHNPDMSGLKKHEKGCDGERGAGRPKGSLNFSTQLENCISSLEKKGKLPQSPDGEPLYNIAMELVSVVFAKGVLHKDKLKAIDMVMDRIEGKPTQKVEIADNDAIPIQVIIPVVDCSKPEETSPEEEPEEEPEEGESSF